MAVHLSTFRGSQFTGGGRPCDPRYIEKRYPELCMQDTRFMYSYITCIEYGQFNCRRPQLQESPAAVCSSTVKSRLMVQVLLRDERFS